MGNLITLEDIQDFRAVSSNLDTSRIDPLIEEAQELDIKPVLGPAQYLDFINNITDQKYQDLLNGVEYTDTGIRELVSFKGVRAALVYYSYARLLLNQDLHVTPSGIAEKTEEWSTNSNQKRIQSQVTASRLAASSHEKDYLKFLNEESQTYPIWDKSCITENATKGGIRISRVTSGGSSQRSGRHSLRCQYCNRHSRFCIC